MLNKNKAVSLIVKVGTLSAIAIILQYIGSAMGLKVGGFLDVEISDYPAIIGALALGPVAGVLIEFIKNLFHLSISTTGFVGELANFAVNGVLVLTVGIIYKCNRTKKGAALALSFGVIAMCAAGVLSNLYIMLPLYIGGAAFSVKLDLVLTLITPFNFVRGIILSMLTMITYKRLSPILHKETI